MQLINCMQSQTDATSVGFEKNARSQVYEDAGGDGSISWELRQ